MIVNYSKKIFLILFISLLVFLPLIPYFSGSPVDEMKPCIFCDIAAGKDVNTKLEVETDDFVIFKDIKPASTYHYLAVPKRHVESLKKLTKGDEDLVTKLEEGMKDFFSTQGINTSDALFGFHLPPFITVKHLHMHGIAPQSTMDLKNRLIFKLGSFWFKTPDEAREYIKQEN